MPLVGVAILAAFVVFELRSSHPMADLRVFRNGRFSAASFSVTMVFLALFGWLFLFTQQLQFVLGYNTLQAGVRALPFAVTIGAVSQPAAKLAARLGTKRVVTAGLGFMAIGFGLMATSTVHTGYGFLLPASMMIAAGMGLAMAPATESIMGSLPPAQAGVGSAINDTTRSLGGALGVAVMGSVASSIFTSRIGSALIHVPAAFAAQAKSSVGAAVTVGQHAPGDLGQNLIEAAHRAFVSGSDQAMIVAMTAAVLGSIVAVRFLPARATNDVPNAPEAAAANALELVAADVS